MSCVAHTFRFFFPQLLHGTWEPSLFLIKSFSRVHFLSQSLHGNLFRLCGIPVAGRRPNKSSHTKDILASIDYNLPCSFYRSSCCQSSTFIQSMPSLTVKISSSIHSFNYKTWLSKCHYSGVIICLVCIVADVDCGVAKFRAAKIVNGIDAAEGEFPW